MATLTYADLVTPLEREAVIADAIAIFAAAGFPTTAWGPTDEPSATIQFEADQLVDLSVTIANIGKMGMTLDATGDALTVHAKDTYGLDRDPATTTRGVVTFTDSTGSPQSFAAGEVIFSSKTDPDLTYKNVDAISVPALGTSSPITIAAEKPGAGYNIIGSDLEIATPPPGITLNVAASTTWITTTGTDEEDDDRLRARCFDRFALIGDSPSSVDAYGAWARAGSPVVNRVRLQEDPTAIDPFPMVTVIVASAAGIVGATDLLAVSTYVQTKRPLGTRVSVVSATTNSVTVAGTYKVKAAYAAAAAAYIDAKLKDWFSGKDITINGETVAGLGIGEGVSISQLYEIIMSAPGVTSCSLVDPLNNLLPNATYPELMPPGPPAADVVPVLVTSSSLLVPVLV